MRLTLMYLLTFCFTLFLMLSCSTSTTESNSITNISVAEFNKKMNESDVVILDVRTPAETAQGMIPGAIKMNIQEPDFDDQIKKLDPEKTYLVYCKAGGRSSRACSKMEGFGMKKLYNLEGGYTAWESARE